MKKFVVFILVVAVSCQALAYGIDGTAFYQSHPKQRALISNYWERFKRTKLADSDSGTQIAANLLLLEAEDKLYGEGLSIDDLNELREEANLLFDQEKTKTQRLAERESVISLAEQIDQIPLGEIKSQMANILSTRPEYLPTYETANNLAKGYADVGVLTERLNAGLILLAIIQKEDYDLSTKLGRRTMDATLRVFQNILAARANSAELESHFQKILSNVPTGLRLPDSLIQRWVELTPNGRKRATLESLGIIWKDWKPLIVLPGLVAYVSFSASLELKYRAAIFASGMIPALGTLLVFLNSMVSTRLESSPRRRGLNILENCRVNLAMLKADSEKL